MTRKFKKHWITITAITLVVYFFVISPIVNLKRLVLQFPAKVMPIIATLDGSISGRHLDDDYKFLPYELEYFMEYLQEVDSNVARLEIFSFVPYAGNYLTDLRTGTLFAITVSKLAIDATSDLAIKIDFDDAMASAGNIPAATKVALDFGDAFGNTLPAHKQNFVYINERVQQIERNKYPSTPKGIPIRQILSQAMHIFDWFITSYDDIAIIANDMENLIGVNEQKIYMLIFTDANAQTNTILLMTWKNGTMKLSVAASEKANPNGTVYISDKFMNTVFENLGTIEINEKIQTSTIQKFGSLDKRNQIKVGTTIIDLLQNGAIAVDVKNKALQTALTNFGLKDANN